MNLYLVYVIWIVPLLCYVSWNLNSTLIVGVRFANSYVIQSSRLRPVHSVIRLMMETY